MNRTTTIALLLLAACREEPPPHGPLDKKIDSELPAPTPPAPVSARHRDACAGLARAGCKEAHPRTGTCEDGFAQAEGNRENVRFDCFAGASTPEVVRSCGGPGYYTVRCQP